MTARPTLVFSSGTGWFHLLTQFVTLSRCDHVALGFGDLLLHARDTGVVIDSRADWLKNNRIITEVEIVPDVSRGLMRCLDLIGQPYDRPGIVRTGLGLALRRGMSPLRPWSASINSHTCSGFVMLIDPHGDVIPEWRAIPRRSVVPVDLLDAIGPSFRPKLQADLPSW